MSRGALSFVLHTHMPYVEGYGTWPFGEEWLWEAIATSYLPLLDVLDAAPGRLTLSLTPVLCDQLEGAWPRDRFLAFLRELRPESHRRDIAAARAAGEHGVAAALERSAALYAAATDAFDRRGGDLLGAFAPHAAWTSSATHAVLPLLATDAGVRLQVHSGVAAHRARFGRWDGGFWLPECAHAPWLEPLLAEAGVHACCVDFTDVLGRGSPPVLRSPAGPLLVPIDRPVVELVWSEGGYPAAGAYLDTHRVTEHKHRAWANDGAPYDPERARAQVAADAADFCARVAERVRGGALSVCALDTELLGHWWPEGPAWLAAVLERCDAAGVDALPLDAALADGRGGAPAPAPSELLPTTWGDPRDLATWSAPAAGGLAWRQRAAELRALAGGAAPSEAALRELLALQASDWAFLVTRDTAGPYPRERADGHERAFAAALAGAPAPGARNLAPQLAAWAAEASCRRGV